MEIHKFILYQHGRLGIYFAKRPLAYWFSYALLTSVCVNAEKKAFSGICCDENLNKWPTKCLKFGFKSPMFVEIETKLLSILLNFESENMNFRSKLTQYYSVCQLSMF
jgi:hypothetical protein